MKAKILNRDFQHPADGWYQIEPKGDHPNKPGKVIQVIDDLAIVSIVNRFNADADAGNLPHGHEMLIDHEHFKHSADKESVAYGWLQKLQNRGDGIYGQIRWSATGKPAVDGGDYRFFSTEYDSADLKILNKATPRRVRPLRLDGLTLTNDPNNKGGKPITNRQAKKKMPADGKCPDCGDALVKDDDGDGDMICPDCQTHFADAGASAANQNETTKKTMNKIASKLGLAAEASEDAVLEAMTKLQNRVSELEPLDAEIKKLKNRVAQSDAEACEALIKSRGVTDEKIVNRLKPILATLATTEDRIACLDDFGIKTPAQSQSTRVLNRGSSQATAAAATTTEGEQEVTEKIRNRCSELQGKGVKFDIAWNQAQREVLTKK